MLAQGQDLGGRRTPRRHRRRRSSAFLALNSNTDLRVFLGAVDSRAPRVHHIHPNPPPFNSIDEEGVFRGGRMEQNSDTRARRQHSTVPVDKGLSALKLICGLTGNIERPGSTETPSRMNRPPRWRRPQRTPRRVATCPPTFRSPRWRAKRARRADTKKRVTTAGDHWWNHQSLGLRVVPVDLCGVCEWCEGDGVAQGFELSDGAGFGFRGSRRV